LAFLELVSKDFENNGNIPSKFTCDGDDISPQLSWDKTPDGTKSFALSVEDPDAPMKTFIHWLVYDIPEGSDRFEQGRLVRDAKQVMNDFGKEAYGGPCPPSGIHRYVFTVYALDVEHLEAVNKNNFFKLVERYALDKANLTGLYKRSTK
jgi:Raf kinase inhibitor-like YbhB/YbcL family protein